MQSKFENLIGLYKKAQTKKQNNYFLIIIYLLQRFLSNHYKIYLSNL